MTFLQNTLKMTYICCTGWPHQDFHQLVGWPSQDPGMRSAGWKISCFASHTGLHNLIHTSISTGPAQDLTDDLIAHVICKHRSQHRKSSTTYFLCCAVRWHLLQSSAKEASSGRLPLPVSVFIYDSCDRVSCQILCSDGGLDGVGLLQTSTVLYSIFLAKIFQRFRRE